jgi:hypothetical protein
MSESHHLQAQMTAPATRTADRRRDGWSPPYAAGLWRLRAASAELDRPAQRV